MLESNEIVKPTEEQLRHIEREENWRNRREVIEKILADPKNATLVWKPVTEGVPGLTIGRNVVARLINKVNLSFDLQSHDLELDGSFDSQLKRFMSDEGKGVDEPIDPNLILCPKGHRLFQVRMQYMVCRECVPAHMKWINPL